MNKVHSSVSEFLQQHDPPLSERFEGGELALVQLVKPVQGISDDAFDAIVKADQGGVLLLKEFDPSCEITSDMEVLAMSVKGWLNMRRSKELSLSWFRANKMLRIVDGDMLDVLRKDSDGV